MRTVKTPSAVALCWVGMAARCRGVTLLDSSGDRGNQARLLNFAERCPEAATRN